MKIIMENWRRFLGEVFPLDSGGHAEPIPDIDIPTARNQPYRPALTPPTISAKQSDKPDIPANAEAQALDPLRGKGRWTSTFKSTKGRKYPHNGLDISAPIGTSIYPIAPGKVVDLKSFELFERLSRIVESNSAEHPGFIDDDTRKINFRHPRIQPDPAIRYCPWNKYKVIDGKRVKTGYRWVQEIYNKNGFGLKEGEGYWHHGGIWVMIKHKIITETGKEEEVTAQYAHLHDLNVQIGDDVDMNTIIGSVGRSGVVCNQPHLHLEIFTGENKSGLTGRVRNGRLIDPGKVLKK